MVQECGKSMWMGNGERMRRKVGEGKTFMTRIGKGFPVTFKVKGKGRLHYSRKARLSYR